MGGIGSIGRISVPRVGGTLGKVMDKTQANSDSLINRTFGRDTTKKIDSIPFTPVHRANPGDSVDQTLNKIRDTGNQFSPAAQRYKTEGGTTEGESRYDSQPITGLYDKTKGYNTRLDEADRLYKEQAGASGQSFLNALQNSANTYKPQIQDLMNQARGQADDAKQTYQTNLQPKLTSMLDSDYREAYGVNGVGGAMSLADAGNPNNSVQTAIRDMYDQQAQGVGRQGQQSSALLGALGAQNAASVFGSAGGPMTVGQQQALYAASQNQAGQAFARTQKEMENLRAQGLDRGFNESAAQYERGERAKGRAKDSASQLSDEEQKYLNKQSGLRGEIGAGAADILGLDSSLAGSQRDYSDLMAGLGQGNSYNQVNRQLGADQALFNNQQAEKYGQAQLKAAKAAQDAGMWQGLGTIAGGIGGAILGGPAGAMAGAGIGSAAGGMLGAQQNPGAAGAGVYGGGYQSPYGQQQQSGYTPYFGGGRAYGR